MAKKSKSAVKKAKKKPAGKKKETAKEPSTKSTAARQLESQLEQLSREIQRVGAQAKEAIASTERESQRILTDLDNKRAVAQKELDRLLGQGDTAFRDLTQGFEKAVQDLDEALKKAFGRFSRKTPDDSA